MTSGEICRGENQNSQRGFAIGIVQRVGNSSLLHYYFKTGRLHGLEAVAQLTPPS